MKPKLLIISDLWGFSNSNWMSMYQKLLVNSYDIVLYDAPKLAAINATNLTEEEIHKQFVNGGIKKAVDKLVATETEKIDVLAFSIGGTIVWKAALKGLKVKSLLAVSSTRLRKETKKPKTQIQLLFGENDMYKPGKDWFKTLKVNYKVIEKLNHNMYKEQQIANLVCKNLNLTHHENINIR